MIRVISVSWNSAKEASLSPKTAEAAKPGSMMPDQEGELPPVFPGFDSFRRLLGCPVVREERIKNGVRNLVANLVGMPLGN